MAAVRLRRGEDYQAAHRVRAAGARRAAARARGARAALLPGPEPGAACMDGLSLRDVSFRYPGATQAALQGLTLAIARGGVFGLLGPNGAGKTTLISLIAGQLRGAAGEMLLDGVPLAEARRGAPRSLGLVPQEQAFYPMLTCRENLRFFGAVQGLGAARLAERVAAVGAPARLGAGLARRARALSRGL